METLRASFLARTLLACLAFVTALLRYHWVRRVPALPPSLRAKAPRVLTVRMANAWSMYVGRFCVTVPMPWSRVYLEGTAISAPWLLPKKAGILTALGLMALLTLAPLTALAQCPGPVQDGTGTVVTSADGTVRFLFEYDDALVDASTGVELQLHRRIAGAITPTSSSQQAFTRAAISKVSANCYSVTLTSVPTLERGFQVVGRARTLFTDGREPSAFSNYADPFLWPLPAPVLRRGV